MGNSSLAKYDPSIHFNHRTPWLAEDVDYLVKYNKDNRTDLSMALGRTYKTIADKIYNLKKSGKIQARNCRYEKP